MKSALWAISISALAALPADAQTLNPKFFGMDIASPAQGNLLPVYSSVGKAGAGGFWYNLETCRPADPTNQSDPCYSWSTLDTVANLYGYTIGVDLDFLILFRTPSWSQASPCSSPFNTNMPDDLTDLYNFATTITKRYAGRIDTWEMANEMSYSGDGCSTGWYSGTVQQIITASQGLCSAVHAAASRAKLYTPSTFFNSGMKYFYQYLAGGGSTCDGVSLHAYPLYTTYNPSQYPEENWNQVQFYSALWNEFGVNAGGNVLLSEAGQQPGTYDPVADAAILLLEMSGFAYNGFNARLMPYAWNQQGRSGSGYTNSLASLTDINSRGLSYSNTETWLAGATVTQPATRTAGANGIRNPNGTGFVAGTPGTPPTNWSLVAPDSANGVSTQFVGACSNNGQSGVSWRIWTPTTVQAGASGFTKLQLEGSQQIAAALGQWWTRGGTLSLVAGSMTGLTAVNQWNENTAAGGNLGATANSVNASVFPIPAPVAQQTSISTIQSNVAFVQPAFGMNYSVGASFDATFCISGQYMDTGNVWTETISRPGGYQGLAVWTANYSGPVPYTPAAQYKFWRDPVGNTGPILNGAVTLTARPLFLETSQ